MESAGIFAALIICLVLGAFSLGALFTYAILIDVLDMLTMRKRKRGRDE